MMLDMDSSTFLIPIRARGDRRAAAALLGSLLAGCGFQPLYGDGGGVIGPTLQNVYVEPISTASATSCANSLLDLFNGTGQADNAQFRLKLSLSETEEAVILQTNTAITRYNYTLSAHYELISARQHASGEDRRHHPRLRPTTSRPRRFCIPPLPAQRDAKNRAANDIAERLRTQIAVYPADLRGPTALIPAWK
jgi:hypothetical protein